MRRVLSLVVFRTLTLVSLAASAALLYDYTRPLPAFCASGGGCEAVRNSSFAYVFGVPQPAFGLLAFLVLFGMTFVPHARRRKLLLPVSLVAAAAGAAFLTIQAFSIGAFCQLCVVVDISAILLVGAAALHYGASERGGDGGVPGVGWTALCALAIAMPLLFGAARPEPPVPSAVASLWAPGKLNIVEMSDFECPFCRLLHPALKEAVEAYGDRVHMVRVSVPLKSHPNAETATKAYLCARNRGKGEAMAHALFVSTRLDAEGVKEAAQTVGVDPKGFDACFTGEEAEQALAKELERARAITFKGLPTLWIGRRSMLGAHSAEQLRAVIEEELSGEAPDAATALPQSWLWGVMAAVFFGTGVLAVVRRARDEHEER